MVFKTSFFAQKHILHYVHQASNIIIFLFIFLTVINFTGCCVYSFTGASVPQHLKTIAIPIAEDRSGSGEPGLKELLTQQLIQKFINDNTLQVTEKVNADAQLDCVILPLSDAPAVVSAGENVEVRRITINVQVTYKDLVKRKTIFDKKFTNFGDYPSGGNFNQRNEAIQTAIDLITEDILLDTVSGW
ncbi:MAG TPA: LPS assembly lipoprotein LptE [Ignavibacteriaceae bacterium]|nr:LPS assembly lipoprotein LptE [Ignavibacteriaceae bacterium]